MKVETPVADKTEEPAAEKAKESEKVETLEAPAKEEKAVKEVEEAPIKEEKKTKTEEKAPTAKTTDSSTDERQMMTIDLVNHNNEQYVGNLLVGDAKKEIPVMFDTGSSLFYLITDACDSASCPQEVRYQTTSSSLFKKGNE